MSYLPTHTLHLEVEARNSLNALAISLQGEIRRTLSVYEGKKVVKTTPYPGWTARVKIGMDLIPLPDRHHLYYTFTERRVWADLKTWYEIPGQSGVNYVKQEFFIGELEGGTHLVSLGEPASFRTDYTVEEVKAAWERARQLEEEASALRSQIREFLR